MTVLFFKTSSCSDFKKYAVLLVVDYWFVFLQLIMITASNFIDLIQFHSIWQMLAKFSRVESERTVSRFRRGKTQLLCCVYLLHKRSCEIMKCYHGDVHDVILLLSISLEIMV